MAGIANSRTDNLPEKLDALPTEPGLYLMKYAGGTVLYVVQAVNLRERGSTRLR
jgi:excinuclease UvrABC nuclease subunit